MPKFLLFLLFFHTGFLCCKAQGYRLIDVQTVSLRGVNFDDNDLKSVEKKLGKPKAILKEYDNDMEIHRITYQYDSLNLEFTEIRGKTYLDYIEILSPKYKLHIEDNRIGTGEKIDQLQKLFPLAFENYQKACESDKSLKDIFKVYMKYDLNGEWIFYGKIVFKLKNNIINKIYVVYSAEF